MIDESQVAEWAKERGLDVATEPLPFGLSVKVRYPQRTLVMQFTDGFANRQGVPLFDVLDCALRTMLSSSATPSSGPGAAGR